MIKSAKSRPIPWTLFLSELISMFLLVLVGVFLVILMLGNGSPMAYLIFGEELRRFITGFLMKNLSPLGGCCPICCFYSGV